MNTVRATRLTALLLPMSLLAPLAVRAEPTVPAGTPVMLEFLKEVSSKTAKKGDKIPFRVHTDVVVDGKTLIRQDATAEGVVTKVHRRRSFGRQGELRIKLESVRDVNGTRVPLEPYTSGDRFKAEGPGAAGAGALVLGPVGLVAGVFVKGKEVTIDKGTRIQAQVFGPQTAAKKGDKEEMIPPVEPKDRAGDLHGEGE
jgi:hypothetical protein